jgi:hypothetical protein
VVFILIVLLCASILIGTILWKSRKPPPAAAEENFVYHHWCEKGKKIDAVARVHEEVTGSSRHPYTIVHGGTVDGEMMSDPPGVNMGRQEWESNLYVSLENIGDTVVVNPWISNGRNNFRTMDEIVLTTTAGYVSAEDKARAIWHHWVRHRIHATTNDMESIDPVKIYNIYGYTICASDALALAALWNRAGLPVRAAHPYGHTVSEVYYDKKWHFIDGDMQSYFLMRDNETIAGEDDLVEDHDLIRRSPNGGILAKDSYIQNERYASLFDGGEGGLPYKVREAGIRQALGLKYHEMKLTLRPGESITWRWGRREPARYHGQLDLSIYDAKEAVCNGLLTYRPLAARGDYHAFQEKDVRRRGASLTTEKGKEGFIVWKIATPYVIVGGRLESKGEGLVWHVSRDGRNWLPAARDLDPFFERKGEPCYAYYLRCTLRPGTMLEDVTIRNDLQMARKGMPALRQGSNSLLYTDDSNGAGKVRIRHAWQERSDVPVLKTHGEPLFPKNGETVPGSKFTFLWRPADRKGIADYQFQLSDRSDMKWPLSPAFDRLVSLASSNDYFSGTDAYWGALTLPAAGLLSSGKTYYWRVRARSREGVWSPWSPVWHFRVGGPLPPLRLKTIADPRRGTIRLAWEPDARGSRPVKYRIYGSDEKGFTTLDASRQIYRGDELEGTKKVIPFRQFPVLPSNLLLETTHMGATIAGAHLDDVSANRAYYRVVAIDGDGFESGPSDVVFVPRPFVWSRPPATARVGQEYAYPVRTIRSLGDLRQRTVSATAYHVAMLWRKDEPKYTLVQSPGWLSIDGKTGLMRGVPRKTGQYPVAVSVTVDGVGKAVQEFVLEVVP